MPTLANIDGRSLAFDLERTLNQLEGVGDRRRAKKDENELIALAQQARGIGQGTFPTQQQPQVTPQRQEKAGGFLRKIAPDFADALAQLNQSRDPEAVDQMRAEALGGRETADRILAAKSQTEKQKIILERAEKVRQQGGDTRELLKQAGNSAAEMDLQAQKAQLTSKAALDLLPAPTDAERLRARAALSVRDPNALVALQRDEKVARDIEARRQAQARAAAAARIADAAPKTDLGKRIAAIRSDIQNQNIDAARGDQLIADAQAAAEAPGVAARAELTAPKSDIAIAINEIETDVANQQLDRATADQSIASIRAEAGAEAVAAADAAEEKENAEAIANLGVLDGIHKQGQEAYEAARASEPSLPTFEEFDQFRTDEITRLSTPTAVLAELRANNPDKADAITLAGSAAVALKTGNQADWDSVVAQTGLNPLPMNQDSMQLLAGVLAGDVEAVAAAVGGAGDDKTVATLTREQEIARIMRTQGVTETIASGIADGVIKTSLDPNTREMIITNLADGTSRVATAQEVTQEVAPTTEATTTDAGAFEGAGQAFGVGGFGKNLANNLLDAVGLPPVSPEVQNAVAAFETLRENLTNTLSSAYNGRVPAFLLKNIQNLTPQPASLTEGTGRAKAKLKALDASLLRADRAANVRLSNRQISPASRAQVGGQKSAISAARSEISSALAGFNQGKSDGTTGSGINFRIVE